jgi:hypothetical protein
MRPWVLLLAVLAVLGMAAAPAAEAGPAPAVTVTNSDATGQVSRFDVDGDSLDVHDGSILRVGNTFYLYGTSYACGYQYQVDSDFCGFKVASSPDLTHWTDRGYILPPGACQYCFRPHVVYNAATKQYVMWADGGGGQYLVATNPAPTGTFTRHGTPTMAGGLGVDLSLYVDDDGIGYVVHNTTQDLPPGMTADMVVEKLNPDYLDTTGQFTRLGLGNVEAFTVFKRDGVFHALMADPTCAYCSGGTAEMTATSMLGPWSGAWYDPDGVDWNGNPQPRWRGRIVNGDSCGGEPLGSLPVTGADGQTTYYFLSDRWNNRAPNESLANLFIGPMGFGADGTLQSISCTSSFTFSPPATASLTAPADLDQDSGLDGFHHYCDIAGAVEREQEFTPSRSGTLSAASITTFQSGGPTAPFTLDVVDGENGNLLSRTDFAAGSVPWAPTALTAHPDAAVAQGHRYLLRAHSATTKGCYGFEYSDSNPYSGGVEHYSVDSGQAFTAESGRDLKFTTQVSAQPVYTAPGLPAGYTQCAAEGGHCAFTGARLVAYGAGTTEGAYKFRVATGGTDCGVAAFDGDPLVGTLKACYLAPQDGPAGYTACATEGGSCGVNGPAMVAYGAAGSYTYRLAGPGGISCDSKTFGGDPLANVVKGCYAAPSGGPASLSACASENGTCTVGSPRMVVYGARGAFTSRWVSGPVSCSSPAFGGDPVPGVLKGCYPS